LDLKALIKKQEIISQKVIIKDLFERLRYISGADCSFDEQYVYSCIVVIDLINDWVVDCAFSKMLTPCPYIPTFLSAREEEPIIQSYKQLKIKPDILFCDGQGIAHPRKAGIASAVGTALDIPTIGVAKHKLCGQTHPIARKKGSYSYLYYKKEIVGVALRTQTDVKVVYVSPGHKVSIDSAWRITLESVRKCRLPEPLRCAHILVGLYKKRNSLIKFPEILKILRSLPG
jgi:deoxyribonuclease V